MTPRNILIFIAVDLAFLVAILLFLSYYGMSHLLLMAMGLVFLLLTLYDLQTGSLSEFFSEFLGLSDPGELGKLKWVPVVLSALLLMLSVPIFIEHGFVNTDQRWAMQHGQFIRVAIPALAGGFIVIAVAVWTVISGSKKSRGKE